MTKKKEPSNYFKRIFELYAETFRNINTDYFYFVFFDLLFFVFASGIVYLAGYVMNRWGELGSLTTIMQTTAQTDIQYLQQIKTTLTTILVVFLVASLLIIIAWSFAKIFIYNKIYKNKFDWMVTLKFILSNIVITIVFVFVLASIPMYVMKNKLPIIASIVLLAMLYLITIYYITFFKLKKFKQAFSNTIHTAIMNLHKYVLPFLICALTVLIILSIFLTITNNIPGSETIMNIINVIFMFFVIAWARLYLVKVVNYVEVSP